MSDLAIRRTNVGEALYMSSAGSVTTWWGCVCLKQTTLATALYFEPCINNGKDGA